MIRGRTPSPDLQSASLVLMRTGRRLACSEPATRRAAHSQPRPASVLLRLPWVLGRELQAAGTAMHLRCSPAFVCARSYLPRSFQFSIVSRTSLVEAPGCRSQERGRAALSLKSVLRLAPLAWMGLPAGVRPGSPSSLWTDRAIPAKVVAIRPSLCAFPRNRRARLPRWRASPARGSMSIALELSSFHMPLGSPPDAPNRAQGSGPVESKADSARVKQGG